jgi:hypothetical protein
VRQHDGCIKPWDLRLGQHRGWGFDTTTPSRDGERPDGARLDREIRPSLIAQSATHLTFCEPECHDGIIPRNFAVQI